MKNTYILEYERAANNLKAAFVAKYFGRDVSDVFWIGGVIGEVLAVNDYFFDLQDIVDFIKYNYTKKSMFEYYDYNLKLRSEDKYPINIKNYRQLK